MGYSSSKHAILGLTKSLAIGWAKDRIQVNCVIPVSAPSALCRAPLAADSGPAQGWIYTDFAGGAIDNEPTRSAILDKTPDPRGYGYPGAPTPPLPPPTADRGFAD